MPTSFRWAAPRSRFAPIPTSCGPSEFRDGEIKRFKFPVRTTPVGSIDPYKDKPPAGDINSQLLFTQANKQLPTI